MKLREDIVRSLFKVRVLVRAGEEEYFPDEEEAEYEEDEIELSTERSLATDLDETPELNGHSHEEADPALQPVRVEKEAGRNDLCPCGSGRKYKKCCGVKALLQ